MKIDKTGMTLRQQVKWWGGICLKDLAEREGFTKEYMYMCMGGTRSNTRLLSAVHQAIEQRKAQLREALITS
jgi:hypothetical protein